MLLKISAAAAALVAATALAGAASAQSAAASQSTGSVQTDNGAAQPTSSQNGPGPAPSSTPTPPATDTTGYNVGAPQTDPNTGAQIVTNGPVPDTKANRARFGSPDSHAGRRTSPAGN
ncbi:MAG TPA: hypothetical protein VHX64_01305 [Caulobacteraceae bacterium]|nr:hypothetical protein [Caulobacteraceae bacterium]